MYTTTTTPKRSQLSLYADFINSLPVGACVYDTQGNMKHYNTAAFDLCGRAPINTHKQIVKATIEKGLAQPPVELTIERPDGSNRLAQVQASPVFNELQQTIGAIVILTDITGSRVLEKNLNLARLAFENAIEGIIMTDVNLPDNGIIFANRSFYELTGYGPEDVIGKNCRFLQGVETNRDTIARMKKNIANGEIFKGEILNYKKNGEPFWNSLTLFPIKNEKGEVSNFAGFQNDITKRKAAEAKAQAATEELEAFNYTVSHDLQNPLRTISGFSNLLMKECDGQLSVQAQEYLEFMQVSARQMSILVKSLLAFSKEGTAMLNLTMVSMDDKVKKVLQECTIGKENFNTGIRLQPLPPAYCDADLIKQVWVNLVTNAIKYSSKKDQPVIEIGCTEQCGEQVYFVKDNGAGFEVNKEKLFRPFQRMHADSEFEGTGVGLATVSRIIKKHGGTIWADSEPGKGATFYFTIPAKSGD